MNSSISTSLGHQSVSTVPSQPPSVLSDGPVVMKHGNGSATALSAASVSGGRSGVASSAQQGGVLDLRRQLRDQNVFVFHLPSEWGEDELKREFSRFGNILSARVAKRPDGSSKGYGFVCFDNQHSAAQAVEQMNGHAVGGKRLKVSPKKTPEECLNLLVQKLMDISEGNQPYDREKDCTLFVFHLPAHWDDKELYSQFQSFGTLVSAKVAKKEDSSSRGYGFVTYDVPRAAAMAITTMNGVEVGSNKRLKVQLKQQANPPHPLPGCTIFVFHLPNDWMESHLRQNFSHYGKILSATVQRDNQGNSRGFGFVSFDRQQSAMNAITGMNGFSVGHKRLKVSLKKGSDRYPQYRSVYPLLPSRLGPVFGPEFGFWDVAAAAVAEGFASHPLPATHLPPHPHISSLFYNAAYHSGPGGLAGAAGYAPRVAGGFPASASGYGYPHASGSGAAAGGYGSYGGWSHAGPAHHHSNYPAPVGMW